MLTIKYFRWTESRAFYKKWEQYWCKLPDQMDKLLFTCIRKKLSLAMSCFWEGYKYFRNYAIFSDNSASYRALEPETQFALDTLH